MHGEDPAGPGCRSVDRMAWAGTGRLFRKGGQHCVPGTPHSSTGVRLSLLFLIPCPPCPIPQGGPQGTMHMLPAPTAHRPTTSIDIL